MINFNPDSQVRQHFPKCLKISLILMIFCIPQVFAEVSSTQRLSSSVEMNNATDQEMMQQLPAGLTITGTVIDEYGDPLVGVTISLKSNKQRGVTTDVKGRYTIEVPSASEVLIVSCIGMKKQEITLQRGVTNYNIEMVSADTVLGPVTVSTGLYQRDKVSFSGAVSNFTGNELREAGSRNVLQTLSILDPSFAIIENLEMGSNPNAMPTIELRGGGSASLQSVRDEFSADPNQPLFVLNGVIVSMTRINDLDMNRIESITLLKDAGSTAIYGSKGANGVVVIETTKPRPGEYKIYYRGLFSADGPDLSVYNMMNAAEKLEFERLAGHYSKFNNHSGDSYPYAAIAKQELYNERLARIARGVDTYWLSEPVRTAFSHEHSVRVAGGSEELAIEVGGGIKKIQGVMKGSGRDVWAGNAMLSYRADRLIISNELDITGYTATASPYGKFSDWVDASPYYEKTDELGRAPKWLQMKIESGGFEALTKQTITERVGNPLWNARLNSYDEITSFSVFNSFTLQYQLTDHLQVKGGIDLSREHKEAAIFIDRDHTKFEDTETSKKGTYEGTNYKITKYSGYLHSFYGQTFNDIHTIGANVRLTLSETDNTFLRTEAEGFYSGSKGRPSTATSYKTNSKPGFFLKIQREVSVIGALNYDYNKRYLLDLSTSLNGSTTFGSNKLFKPFWGVGLGWNIDREEFASTWNWADMIKLRASIGTNGNQNIGQVTSTTVYNTFLSANVFGQGMYIQDLGNPNLPWQVTTKINAGFDFRALRGRASLTFDVFRQKTDPLIVSVPQIPSTGLSTYAMHMGTLTTKGFEWVAAFSPIHNPQEEIYWKVSVSGAYISGKYGGFGEKMDTYNKTMRSSNELRQFKDGYSPTDIWAVRSAGIDPATGQEIYITKDNTFTFLYNSDDLVRVGNVRPDLSGAIITSLHYKNFNAFIAMSYSIGGDKYNYDLYNKVENITLSGILKNQDKRALYDRWKSEGDIAAFKSIRILTDLEEKAMVKTSRFVQKDNYLRASSIKLTYDINQNGWLKNNLKVEMVSLSFTMNELFRLETSKMERGTSYPFARQFSLGINVNF